MQTLVLVDIMVVLLLFVPNWAEKFPCLQNWLAKIQACNLGSSMSTCSYATANFLEGRMILLIDVQVTKSCDGFSTNRYTKSHSMCRGLLVNTSGCNQQNFLDRISVPSSRAFPCVPHKLMYEHPFGTPTTVWCSKVLHSLSIVAEYHVRYPWSGGLILCPSMDLGLGVTHWSSFHHFQAPIPISFSKDRKKEEKSRGFLKWVQQSFLLEANRQHDKLKGRRLGKHEENEVETENSSFIPKMRNTFDRVGQNRVHWKGILPLFIHPYVDCRFNGLVMDPKTHHKCVGDMLMKNTVWVCGLILEFIQFAQVSRANLYAVVTLYSLTS